MPTYQVDYEVSAIINIQVEAGDLEEASAVSELELPWESEIDGHPFSILKINQIDTFEVEDE